MDATLEGKLLARAEEVKETLTDQEYLGICRIGMALRDAKELRDRGLVKDLRERVRVLLDLLQTVREKKEVHLLGPPSTHGGSCRANNSDLIYRAHALRSGRGTF